MAIDPSAAQSHAREVAAGERFRFGRNWRRFLALVDDARVAEAERSLQRFLGRERLDGLSFLDIGCGSGLFSLAARRLGARVASFDYDPDSVACTRALKARFRPGDAQWTVAQGSVLDEAFLRGLGEFDLVYSWGVLHHTGAMWRALELAALPVRHGGLLLVAIYNDCGATSRRWRAVKRLYNRLPAVLKPVMAALVWAFMELREALGHARRLQLGAYVRSLRQYRRNRGMSRWHNALDWIGGYPYEYAGAARLVAFYAERGFAVERLEEAQGLGCHELLVRRTF
jgi:2-polyprenyl-6-hydroxyphenyl methylase/3-demethylubiquinone-9 3-methyltransferase